MRYYTYEAFIMRMYRRNGLPARDIYGATAFRAICNADEGLYHSGSYAKQLEKVHKSIEKALDKFMDRRIDREIKSELSLLRTRIRYCNDSLSIHDFLQLCLDKTMRYRNY